MFLTVAAANNPWKAKSRNPTFQKGVEFSQNIFRKRPPLPDMGLDKGLDVILDNAVARREFGSSASLFNVFWTCFAHGVGFKPR